jgi:hypothetical protein
MLKQPFSPAYGQTQAVTVSNAGLTIGVDPLAKQVRVLNPNAFVVFVRCSGNQTAAVPAAGATASEGDYPIGPNSSEVITKSDVFGSLSLIATGANTGTVYVTPGEGYQSAAA